jgi:HEAT repeat protein
LGRIGERAKAAAPALAEALKSEDAALRVDVAEALWQANKDPAAVTALAAALKDKDWRVIQCAAEALERIGVEAKAAVPALLETLNDGWVRERWALSICTAPGCHAVGSGPPDRLPPARTLWLLWRIDRHPAVMPALLNALKDPAHRAGAARTLGRIGVEAKEAVPVLLKLLDEENGATRIDRTEGPLTQYREALTYALWQINKHPAYIPALIEGLKDKNPSMRVYYITALGGIGPEAKAAVPALAEALKDEKDFVHRAATDALGKIGADAAVPALVEALKDGGRVRVYAAEALWRINQHPAAVPALAEVLTNQGPFAEGYGNPLWVLSDIGVEAQAAAPALAEALKDKHVDGRVEAAVTLWKINKDPAVVPVLVDALNDTKAKDSTRVRAAKALWQFDQHPAAVAALVEVVNDLKVDGHMRMFAAKELWQINKHPAAVTALVEVLTDKDAGLRSAAAEALWQIDRHPAAVPALIGALRDRDIWVSSAAAKALGRIGAEAKAAEVALAEALNNDDADASR